MCACQLRGIASSLEDAGCARNGSRAWADFPSDLVAHRLEAAANNAQFYERLVLDFETVKASLDRNQKRWVADRQDAVVAELASAEKLLVESLESATTLVGDAMPHV